MPSASDQNPPTTENTQWPALLRGSVLSSVQSKHVHYIGLADRRAQVIITINAFLIPLTLTGYAMPEIQMGIILVTTTAAFSILFAIISLMPKRYQPTDLGQYSLLHFSGIWGYSEEEYKALMREALESRNSITELMVSDIYHLSNDVLRPKFRWIRFSFYSFLLSLLCSLLFILIPLVT